MKCLKNISSQINSGLIQVVFYILLPLSVFAASIESIKDERGRLSFTLLQDGFSLVESTNGSVLLCEGCLGSPRTGEPDRPYFSFTVISSPDTNSVPQIKITITEAGAYPVKTSPSPVPEYLSPSEPRYVRDNESYQQAAKINPVVGSIRWMRGVPVRTIMVPLASWDALAKQFKAIHMMTVTVSFSGVQPQAIPVPLPGVFLKSLFNPIGGGYLITRAADALSKKSASVRSVDLEPYLLKIQIGDTVVGSQDEDGVYELAYDLIREAGIDNDFKQSILAARVEHIRLFTGTGGVLPDAVEGMPTGGTLREIPMEVFDNNNNGIFDEGDVIRFYAHGTSQWKVLPGNVISDTVPVNYRYEVNPYSFYNYYFLEFSTTSTNGKRIPTLSSPSSGTAHSESWSYVRAEKETGVAACDPSGALDDETGRYWHWFLADPDICAASKNRTFSGGQLRLPSDVLPDYTSGKPLYLGVYLAEPNTQDLFDITFSNGTAEFLSGFRPGNGAFYRYEGSIDPDDFRFESLSWRANKINVGFDGYSVVYYRAHRTVQNPVTIFPVSFGDNCKYVFSKLEDNRVALKLVDNIAVGKLKISNNAFTDNAEQSDNVKYFLYPREDVQTVLAEQLFVDTLVPPEGVLMDLNSGDNIAPEYIIISPGALIQEALDLKIFRQQKGSNALRTAVVRTEDIYRQFSSGRLSPIAIRDFIRWAYNGWNTSSSSDTVLKYVTLFGDGYYDYRNIKIPTSKGLNYIPPFENGARCTDDFFVYLDVDDIIHSSAQIDVSIGRIPVGSQIEAQGYVEKIKKFEDPSFAGPWRNTFISTADDNHQRGKIDGIPHTNYAENIVNKVQQKIIGMYVEKVYLLDYESNFSYSKPEAAQDLLNLLNQGALAVNYFGHGSYDVWADEGLMVLRKTLPKLTNNGKNGLYSAFSCTVGRFEKYHEEGMSETLVSTPQVGGIAAVSASRETYAGPNNNLATKFFEKAFEITPDGETFRLGDALRMAKATGNIINNEKYHLFGEPVTFLRKPSLTISFSQLPDTISSMDCGTIIGTVKGGSGEGHIQVKVFGAGMEKAFNIEGQRMFQRGELIFSNTVPYKNGLCTLKYIFKERLPFGDTTAVIKAFAWDANKELEGSLEVPDIIVHGEKNNCDISDTDGPAIRISGCNRSQTSSIDFPKDIKIALPYCLEIVVTDSTGGVSSAELPDEGTTIEVYQKKDGFLSLLESPSKPSLGDDGFVQKTFKWNLPSDMRPGQYLLKIRAQDGFGNVRQRNQNFEISTKSEFKVYKVINAPNPVRKQGTCFYYGEVAEQSTGEFYVKEEEIKAEIMIFNQSGYLVKHLRDVLPRTELSKTDEQSCRERNAWWDGRDHWGQKLGNGTYFYKVKITQKSLEENSETKTSTLQNVLAISR
ncbi:MAG: hypothetical protein HQK83_01295 [Fibrobacteria bacterium]|nr:hypothetical protein [Fibrobacteria bacterium]